MTRDFCTRCGARYDGVTVHGPGSCTAAESETPARDALAEALERIANLRESPTVPPPDYGDFAIRIAQDALAAPRPLPLTQGKVALVDAADYELVAGYKWYASSNNRGWYAQRGFGKPRQIVRLHNVLMGEPPTPGLHVDHINGDGLDNRRENLRWVTHAQNGMNRRDRRGASHYRGVHLRGRRWVATLRVNGRRTSLGGFGTEEEAARAWDRAAAEAYGEYAALNFPALRAGSGDSELAGLLVELARWSRVAERNGDLHARIASVLALSEAGSSAAGEPVGERQGRQPASENAAGSAVAPHDEPLAALIEKYERLPRFDSLTRNRVVADLRALAARSGGTEEGGTA